MLWYAGLAPRWVGDLPGERAGCEPLAGGETLRPDVPPGAADGREEGLKEGALLGLDDGFRPQIFNNEIKKFKF